MLVYQNLYIWHFPKYLAFSNFRVGNKPSIKEEEEIPALSFLYYKYILYFLQPPLQFAQLPNIYCFFPFVITLGENVNSFASFMYLHIGGFIL